eukprot:3656123-Rhodomonas_salina.4
MGEWRDGSNTSEPTCLRPRHRVRQSRHRIRQSRHRTRQSRSNLVDGHSELRRHHPLQLFRLLDFLLRSRTARKETDLASSWPR